MESINPFSSVPLTVIIDGAPVPKPRMTRSDKWKQRRCVMEYRAWADKCRRTIFGGNVNVRFCEEDNIELILMSFYLPIPPSYSMKKKKEVEYSLHKIRPDIDNLEKSVLDALFLKDSVVPAVFKRKFFTSINEKPKTCLTFFRRGHIRKEALDYNASVTRFLLRSGNP